MTSKNMRCTLTRTCGPDTRILNVDLAAWVVVVQPYWGHDRHRILHVVDVCDGRVGLSINIVRKRLVANLRRNNGKLEDVIVCQE